MFVQRIFRALLIVAFSLSFLAYPHRGKAQSETGYDLVAAVNALRASHGLEPYTIDPWIMDYAQQHSQFQADTQTSTHGHSDGTNSLAVGLRENVAGGDYGYVTVSLVVYEIWADPGHLNTMIGYESGQAGAGVAVGNNDTVYYTLNVRPGGTTNQTISTTSSPTEQSGLSAPFIPIITSTPAENGNIIHIVEFGETLWGIAVSYGVTMDDIRGLNGMSNDEITIYVGQRLFIRQVQVTTTPTAVKPTSTSTSPPPLPTESPTQTPVTIPTLTPTKVLPEQPANQTTGNIFVLGIGVGTIVVGLISLLRKRK